MKNRIKFLSILMSSLMLFLSVEGSGNEDEAFLRGHMQPLGAHRDPDLVEERSLDQLPTALEFWDRYLLPSKPVVFRGAASKSLGAQLWTDTYLKETYGDLEFRLEGHKEKAEFSFPEGDMGLGRDTMKNFINTYHNSTKYIVSELPKPMFHEISVLPFMECAPFKDKIVEVDLWMNGNNASSIMHKDAFNQLNCLLNGTKEWKLIDYKYEDKIYKRYEDPYKLAGYSKINVHAVNFTKYPQVAEVPWQYTVVNAGDCLYLPGSMYHQVQSYGHQNLAVSLLFKRFQFQKETEQIAADLSECVNDSSVFQTLDKYSIDWEYSGKGVLSMGNSELDTFKTIIMDLYRKTGKLSIRRIKRRVGKERPKLDDLERNRTALRVYKKIVRHFGTKFYTGKDFSPNKTALREISLELEPEEPTNSYNCEYSMVNPNEILRLLRVGLKKGEGFGSREIFIQQYKKYLGGTTKFANQFLDALIKIDEDFYTLENVRDNAGKALALYTKHQREETSIPVPGYDVGDIEDNLVKGYVDRMQDIINEDDVNSDFYVHSEEVLRKQQENQDAVILNNRNEIQGENKVYELDDNGFLPGEVIYADKNQQDLTDGSYQHANNEDNSIRKEFTSMEEPELDGKDENQQYELDDNGFLHDKVISDGENKQDVTDGSYQQAENEDISIRKEFTDPKEPVLGGAEKNKIDQFMADGLLLPRDVVNAVEDQQREEQEKPGRFYQQAENEDMRIVKEFTSLEGTEMDGNDSQNNRSRDPDKHDENLRENTESKVHDGYQGFEKPLEHSQEFSKKDEL